MKVARGKGQQVADRVPPTCTKGSGDRLRAADVHQGRGDHTRTGGEEGRPHQQQEVTRRGRRWLRGKTHRQRRVRHAPSGAPWHVVKEGGRRINLSSKQLAIKSNPMTQPFIGNQILSGCTSPASTTTSVDLLRPPRRPRDAFLCLMTRRPSGAGSWLAGRKDPFIPC